MLSIQPVSRGGDYHAYLASEYYLEDAQVVRWFGRGAEKLGLDADADKETINKLFDGYGPDGKPLVQNAGEASRKKLAWDLTFSAPKDVSTLWAVADKDTRERIRRCHEAAVREALDYLEDVAGVSRQKTGGELSHAKAGLIVATFSHGASREKDPQIHTHGVVFNACVRDDGSTGTVLSRPLYRHKMAAGSVYQATLAAGLTSDLGLQLTAQKHGFGIEGVPQALSKWWSKRREQINQALGGLPASAEASAVAALDTRQAKETQKVSGLFDRWKQEARDHGFGPEQAKALLGRVSERERQRSRERHVAEKVQAAAEKLLETNSHLSERELVRASADRLRDGSAAGSDIRRAVSSWFSQPGIVNVGYDKGESRFSTQAVIDQERKLLSQVRELAGQKAHAVAERDVTRAAKQFPQRGVSQDDAERNKGQLAAVEHLTRSDGVSVLSGIAGTGKSTVLKSCREIWEKNGYTVTGMALAGKAAKELAQASGIESETLAMRLLQLDKPAQGQGRKSFTIDSKTVVVLDEAGMVGTNDFARLVAHVKDSGAKLVLTGDSKQLQPIAAGSPFARIERDIGRAELTHITRQHRDEADSMPLWRRHAVTLFAEGKAKEALEMFAERKLLAVEANRAKACEKLVADWKQHGGVADPKSHLIIAGTNEDVRALNALCQGERLQAANPSSRMKVATANGERFHEGDRVLFTKKDRTLKLDNGEAGTVAGITGFGSKKTLHVNLDDGRLVAVPLADYADVRLGYAITTHKAQGATVPHSYVLLGGPMQDLHLSYVQASRARETTRFYADRFEAGPKLERLTQQMGEERTKELAIDVIEQRMREQKQSQRFEQHGHHFT